MSNRNYTRAAGIIFLLVAMLHALRLYFGWDASIGGWDVPAWVSWVALLIGAYLGWQGLSIANKK